jgi:hypothetical protein
MSTTHDEPHEPAGLNPYAASPRSSASAGLGRTQIPHRTIAYLRETRVWALILAVLLLLATVLAAASGGLLVFALLSMPAARPPEAFPFILAPLALIAAMAACCGASAVLLWRYAACIGAFAHRPDSARLNAALAAQRTFWCVSGLLLLAMFAVWGLGMAGIHLTSRW